MFEAIAANWAPVDSFHFTAPFLFVSPDVRERWSGTVDFRRPRDFCIAGRDPRLNVLGFVLRCSGDACVLELPRNKEQKTYYYPEGIPENAMPFSIPPKAIIETFSPATWETLRAGPARIVGRDPLTVEIGPRRRPERRIILAGPPWVVVQNNVLDRAGNVEMSVLFSEHCQENGVWFPRRVEIEFPSQKARLTVKKLRNLRLNVEMEDDLFAVESPRKRPLSD